MAATGPETSSGSVVPSVSSLPSSLGAPTAAPSTGPAMEDAPEGERIVLLDLDENLEALLERPEEAMVLATGMRGGWSMNGGAGSEFVTPTPSWRIIPPEEQQQMEAGATADGMAEEDEDDSNERYAALYDSVRETCGRIREEEQRQARQLEEEARLEIERYNAPKRRHLS